MDNSEGSFDRLLITGAIITIIASYWLIYPMAMFFGGLVLVTQIINPVIEYLFLTDVEDDSDIDRDPHDLRELLTPANTDSDRNPELLTPTNTDSDSDDEEARRRDLGIPPSPQVSREHTDPEHYYSRLHRNRVYLDRNRIYTRDRDYHGREYDGGEYDREYYGEAFERILASEPDAEYHRIVNLPTRGQRSASTPEVVHPPPAYETPDRDDPLETPPPAYEPPRGGEPVEVLPPPAPEIPRGGGEPPEVPPPAYESDDHAL